MKSCEFMMWGLHCLGYKFVWPITSHGNYWSCFMIIIYSECSVLIKSTWNVFILVSPYWYEVKSWVLFSTFTPAFLFLNLQPQNNASNAFLYSSTALVPILVFQKPSLLKWVRHILICLVWAYGPLIHLLRYGYWTLDYSLD